jgi:shikimate dehydrogenase
MTTKFCVVGSPIKHSLSPLLHRAAYAQLGLDFSYEAVEVAKANLLGFLEENQYQGVSVTMPLKTEAFELSVQASDTAIATRAANTLVRSSAGWSCENTDVYGLSQALGAVGTCSQIAIIGSGATTLSALTSLASIYSDSEVIIYARDANAASAAVAFGSALGLKASSAELSASSIGSFDLVLSLVPAGSYPELWDEVSYLEPRPKGWLFDVSYNPWPSVPAASWGSEKVISGLEMLIWQAIEQVQIFSSSVGQELNLDRQALYSVMRKAVSSK